MKTIKYWMFISALLTVITLIIDSSGAQKLPGGLSDLVGQKKVPVKAGARDCVKASAAYHQYLRKHAGNPIAALKGPKDCTYLEKVAWKPPTTRKLPRSVRKRGLPGKREVVARVKRFWTGGRDEKYVTVISGGVTGRSWYILEMANRKGIPSSRTIKVYHTIKAKLAGNKKECFVLYGQLKEKNLNHPRRIRARWSASLYQASDYKRAQKISCTIARRG